MNDESGSSTAPPRTWLERLGHAFSGEPRNRDELVDELRDAQSKGLLAPGTLAMIEGAIKVAESQVADVMVPRGQMVAIAVAESLDRTLAIVIESGHSRFPVHGEDRDDILGILLAKDLLRACAHRAPEPLPSLASLDETPLDADRLDCGTAAASVEVEVLRNLLRPVVLIPESKRLDVLLDEFRASRNHMAIVVDEYGGVAGLVTIEDVLEVIVGEIDDEHDDAPSESSQIRTRQDGNYAVDALTPIHVFNTRFNADFGDDEYDTIGGLVVAGIGHLPEVGEELESRGFHFRVSRADARRVHTFHVRPAAPV